MFALLLFPFSCFVSHRRLCCAPVLVRFCHLPSARAALACQLSFFGVTYVVYQIHAHCACRACVALCGNCDLSTSTVLYAHIVHIKRGKLKKITSTGTKRGTIHSAKRGTMLSVRCTVRTYSTRTYVRTYVPVLYVRTVPPSIPR